MLRLSLAQGGKGGASFSRLCACLTQALGGDRVQDMNDWYSYIELIEGHPVISDSVIYIVLSVIGLIILGVWRFFKKPESPKPATPPATGQATIPTQEYTQLVLDQAEMLRVKAQHAKTQEDLALINAMLAETQSKLENIKQAYEDEKKRSGDIIARLKREGNTIDAERLKQAIALAARFEYGAAEKIFQSIKDENELNVEQSARASFGLGKIAAAELRWQDAAEHFGTAAHLHPSFEHNLAASYYYQRVGQYDRAMAIAKDNVALAKRDFGTDHPSYATGLNNLSSLLQATGRYKQAEPLYQEALEIAKNALGTDHPTYATSLNNLAGLLEAKGQYEKAEPLYEEALEIIKKALGTDHPDYAASLNNLAGLLEETGRLAQAEPLYQEALEISKKALGTEHPNYATSLNNLAGLLEETGRLAEAEPLYKEDLEITKNALGTEHPDYATSLNNLALLLKAKGEYEKAEPLYREALEIRKKALGTDHPSYAASLNNLAELFRAKGEYEKAEPLYQEALKISKKALGADHPTTKTIQANYDGLLTDIQKQKNSDST